MDDPREPPHPPVFDPPTEGDWDRLNLAEAVSRLMDIYGAGRVSRIARNLAAMRGEE